MRGDLFEAGGFFAERFERGHRGLGEFGRLLARSVEADDGRIGGFFHSLVLAGGFVGFELLRGEILTGFPWNLMGTVWAFDALPIQMAAVIGVHGLSLITLLVAATPILDRRAFLGGVAVLAFCGTFGFARLWAPEPEPQPVGLLIVQGNIAQEVKWREESRVPILRRYVEATREAALAALP